MQEGTFQRKANGKNTFLPDDGGTPIFVSERNSMSALTGDRVRVQFLARRRNHIKEAMVTEILHRKKDTFTGKLRVDRDIAFLVTQEALFVHDILVPKKRLKGGKTAIAPWCVSRSGLTQSTRTSSERWWTCSDQRATTMWR